MSGGVITLDESQEHDAEVARRRPVFQTPKIAPDARVVIGTADVDRGWLLKFLCRSGIAGHSGDRMYDEPHSDEAFSPAYSRRVRRADAALGIGR